MHQNLSTQTAVSRGIGNCSLEIFEYAQFRLEIIRLSDALFYGCDSVKQSLLFDCENGGRMRSKYQCRVLF